jgi:hypothetical protein
LVDGPRVIDVGSDRERVEKVVVGIIGGRVNVVTHDDGYGARVEVSNVEGLPLRVSWDGRTLKVMHTKDGGSTVLDTLRRLVEQVSGQHADVSISVPASARATVSTVTAPIVVSGLRRGLAANTVSGEMTISDVQGRSTINTVSGATECADLVGDAKINSVSGSVTVQSSDIPRARINTVSGEVALDLVNTHLDVQSSSVTGDVIRTRALRVCRHRHQRDRPGHRRWPVPARCQQRGMPPGGWGDCAPGGSSGRGTLRSGDDLRPIGVGRRLPAAGRHQRPVRPAVGMLGHRTGSALPADRRMPRARRGAGIVN